MTTVSTGQLSIAGPALEAAFESARGPAPRHWTLRGHCTTLAGTAQHCVAPRGTSWHLVTPCGAAERACAARSTFRPLPSADTSCTSLQDQLVQAAAPRPAILTCSCSLTPVSVSCVNAILLFLRGHLVYRLGRLGGVVCRTECVQTDSLAHTGCASRRRRRDPVTQRVRCLLGRWPPQIARAAGRVTLGPSDTLPQQSFVRSPTTLPGGTPRGNGLRSLTISYLAS